MNFASLRAFPTSSTHLADASPTMATTVVELTDWHAMIEFKGRAAKAPPAQ